MLRSCCRLWLIKMESFQTPLTAMAVHTSEVLHGVRQSLSEARSRSRMKSELTNGIHASRCSAFSQHCQTSHCVGFPISFFCLLQTVENSTVTIQTDITDTDERFSNSKVMRKKISLHYNHCILKENIASVMHLSCLSSTDHTPFYPHLNPHYFSPKPII